MTAVLWPFPKLILPPSRIPRHHVWHTTLLTSSVRLRVPYPLSGGLVVEATHHGTSPAQVFDRDLSLLQRQVFLDPLSRDKQAVMLVNATTCCM
jgi:hypothetical protein